MTEAAPARTEVSVPRGERAWWPAGLAVAAVAWGAQQFVPLLLMYAGRLRLSDTTIQATFVAYVLALVPGLLVGGPISDRYGRRRVMVPTLLVSIAATGLLIVGGVGGPVWLFAGRAVSGLASGAAFSSGAAWIKEISALGTTDGVNHGPRRVTVAMSIGFGVAPLVSGLLAQWAPAPTLVPYLPHLLLAAAAVPLALSAPETHVPSGRTLRRALLVPEVRLRRFLLVVVPLAPWVFGSAAVSLAYLPGLVRGQLSGRVLVFSAVVAFLTAGSGIAVQPLARRLADPDQPLLLLRSALGIVVAGLLLAALAAAATAPALVLAAAVVLGSGYGCSQVCGLLEVQRLAHPTRLAGLTAVYQAMSYVGFVVTYPLAAASGLLSPAGLLLILAAMAGATLVWTNHAAGSTPRR